MKKNVIGSALLLSLLSIISCNPFEKDLSGLWFYTPSKQRAKNDTSLTPTSFLYLQKEGNYTSDLGRYEYGNWTTEGDELILNNNRGGSQRIRIKQQAGQALQLFANESQVVSFQKYPDASGTSNPFALVNNKWRIPAAHAETEAEIKARLYNHCQFWECYFTWALDKNIDGLDVVSTPTPLKIYGNGFGLKKYEELPAVWLRYFYDSTDCRRADTLIKTIFRKRNIKWPKTDVTYEKFISAFQQLQAQLK